MTFSEVNMSIAGGFSEPSYVEYAPQAISGPVIESAYDFNEDYGGYEPEYYYEPYYPSIQSAVAPSIVQAAPALTVVPIGSTVVPIASAKISAQQAQTEASKLLVGGQKIITAADGSKTDIVRQTENSYTVMKYNANGKLISSEIKYDDQSGTVRQVGSPSLLASSGESNDLGTLSAAKPTDKSIKLVTQAAAPDTPIAPESPEAPEAPPTFPSLEEQLGISIDPGLDAALSPVRPESPDLSGITKKTSPVDLLLSPVAVATKYTQEQRDAIKKAWGLNDAQIDIREARGDVLTVSDDGKVSFDPAVFKQSSPLIDAVVHSSGTDETVEAAPDSSPLEYDVPETPEQYLDAYRKALDKYNYDGSKNGENEVIVKYFGDYVPLIVQNKISAPKLARFAYSYEDIINGSVSSSRKAYVPGKGYVGETSVKPFNTLSYQEQVDTLKNFMLDSANNEIHPLVALQMIRRIIDSVPDDSRRLVLDGYVKNGEFEKDLHAFGTGSPVQKIIKWAKSDSGLISIGGAFAFVSTAAVTLASGGLAGLATTGINGFLTTEFYNAFRADPYRDKATLEAKGQYDKAHEDQYDQNYSSTKAVIDKIGYLNKNTDPSVRLKMYQDAQESFNALTDNLSENFIFLKSRGTYEYELQRYKDLKNTLDNLGLQMDVTTGALDTSVAVPAEITIIPPKGGKISGDGFSGGIDAPVRLTKNDQGLISFEVYDSDGKLVKTDSVSYYPGNVINRDYTNLRAWGGGSGSSSVPKPVKITTVDLQPGYTMTIGSQVYEGGVSGKSFDIPVDSGAPTEVLIEADGKKSSKTKLYWDDGTWSRYAPTLEDEFAPYSKPELGQGLQFDVTPDSVVKVNGATIDMSKDYNKKIWLDPGYYAVEIATPGKKTWQKQVYIGDDQFLTLTSPAEDAPAQKTYGGGGGGGGGGSSGGARAISQTLIIFGDTCAGATIYLDDALIEPEIGKSYSIEPGYHAVVLKKEGKKDWLKTVYASSGDTLTISPAFEDADYTNEDDEQNDDEDDEQNDDDNVITSEPKRVFINSNPSGAKVLLNGGYTGEWTPCYLDLLPGYYTIGIQKTGYQVYNQYVYVGDIIAWGNQAYELARLVGWI